MSNFQSCDPDEYLQKFWDEYGPALWDYLVMRSSHFAFLKAIATIS